MPIVFTCTEACIEIWRGKIKVTEL